VHDLNSNRKSTFIGFSAILFWGMLALFTSFSGEIPPFQLTAMTFFLAFLAGTVYFIRSGADFRCLKQPLSVWLNGIFGLFGYHALYFMAMKSAPSIEVSLIAYLWPVLIVLFSSFLPGERLRWFHLLGVVLGFCGVFVLLQSNGSIQLNPAYIMGYALALACAIIWSVYSVVSRKNKDIPTVLIGAFCGVTAVLSLICHVLFETTVVPKPTEWLAVFALGIGPVGLAFFAWDEGMKRGNIKLLGTLAYIAPLLSSALLILFHRAMFHMNLVVACLLIAGGSLVASLDRLRKTKQ